MFTGLDLLQTHQGTIKQEDNDGALTAVASEILTAIIISQNDSDATVDDTASSNKNSSTYDSHNTSAQRKNRHIVRYLLDDFVIRDVCSYMDYGD